jgi:3-phenylpropionate/trans-cinnamate dioxygenase ferredoxin reductase component
VENIVIVGASHAGAQAADTLRRKGYSGRLTLVGDEVNLPYQRPPLSKKYLAGELAIERLNIRPAEYYRERSIELVLGQRAVAIDRQQRLLCLENKTLLPYDRLLLATGTRPRRLTVPGHELGGIYMLRDVNDALWIHQAFKQARRVVVVGAGYLGLEAAATARQMGLEVTVLEVAERILNRVAAAPLANFFQQQHVARGVDVLCGMQVQEFIADSTSNRVAAVRCRDGREIAADVVVVSVGVIPNDELARAAGLTCDNGIVVDEYSRTNDPDIYASGDCANQPSLRYGYRVRLESVDNAFEQSTSAALNMLGVATRHDKLPWFWSDQYDLKLVIVGLSHGHDHTLVRGDPDSRSFSVCYLRGRELIAIDTVNQAKDQMAARKVIATPNQVDLTKLADSQVPLKECLQ